MVTNPTPSALITFHKPPLPVTRDGCRHHLARRTTVRAQYDTTPTRKPKVRVEFRSNHFFYCPTDMIIEWHFIPVGADQMRPEKNCCRLGPTRQSR